MSLNGVPKRYVLSILIFWGFFTMYALRTNINVAIGAMVKNHTVFKDGKEIETVGKLNERTTVVRIFTAAEFVGQY